MSSGLDKARQRLSGADRPFAIGPRFFRSFQFWAYNWIRFFVGPEAACRQRHTAVNARQKTTDNKYVGSNVSVSAVLDSLFLDVNVVETRIAAPKAARRLDRSRLAVAA